MLVDGSVTRRGFAEDTHWSRGLKGKYDFVRCKDSRGKQRRTSGGGKRVCKDKGV